MQGQVGVRLAFEKTEHLCSSSGVGAIQRSSCFSRNCGNSGGEAAVGGRGQGIHTPHLTYTSSLPLSVSYGPSGFEQMSSVPRAQGSWQTLGRSQALTCFKRLLAGAAAPSLNEDVGGLLLGTPCSHSAACGAKYSHTGLPQPRAACKTNLLHSPKRTPPHPHFLVNRVAYLAVASFGHTC